MAAAVLLHVPSYSCLARIADGNCFVDDERPYRDPIVKQTTSERNV